MNKTGIQYLDYTWNPIAMRCTPCSPGCANCWHLAMADRMAANPKILPEIRAAYAGDCVPVLVSERVEEPLSLRKPARIGVQFMGDWLHPAISEDVIDTLLEVMAACPQHTFLTLTKRADQLHRLWRPTEETPFRELGGGDYLSNVWLGVTVENQQTADERIPLLLQALAAHRWVSVEPLLEPVDLVKFWKCPVCDGNGMEFTETGDALDMCYACSGAGVIDSIDYVVAGCESGPRRRHVDLSEFRYLRDQCRQAGVPLFIKQVEIDGKVSHDPGEWPEDLQVREGLLQGVSERLVMILANGLKTLG